MDAATHMYIQYIQYRSNDPNVQSNYSTVYSIVCTARSCAHVLMVRALVHGVLLRSSAPPSGCGVSMLGWWKGLYERRTYPLHISYVPVLYCSHEYVNM